MKRQLATNAAGAIGYLFTLLGWIWSAMLLFTGTQLLDTLKHTQDTDPLPVLKFPEIALPDPVTITLAACLVVLMVGLSLYSIYKAPSTAVKVSSRSLHKSADKALTVIQRRRPMPAKKSRLLTSRLVFYGKLILVLAPVVVVAGLIFFASSDMELAPELAALLSAGISLLALLFFAIQYGLAKLLKVSTKKLI